MTSPHAWPGGARAAISLTYDDNCPTHLDHAMPDLEAAGLRGTFYLITGPDAQRSRDAEWAEAYRRGHEIGNHTVTHPCRGANGTLEVYTPGRILDEVTLADDWIDQHIGPDPDRSFAYPCGNLTIGPDDAQDAGSYEKAVLARHYAARAVGNDLNLPAEAIANMLFIKAVCIHDTTPDAADRMVEYCERSAAAGAWGVLVFHGIGGDWLSTSRETHGRVIAHLVAGREKYWIAPFRDVAKFLAR